MSKLVILAIYIYIKVFPINLSLNVMFFYAYYENYNIQCMVNMKMLKHERNGSNKVILQYLRI